MNQSEISLLQQDIYILVENYIRNNILDFSNPYFNSDIYICKYYNNNTIKFM